MEIRVFVLVTVVVLKQTTYSPRSNYDCQRLEVTDRTLLGLGIGTRACQLTIHSINDNEKNVYNILCLQPAISS